MVAEITKGLQDMPESRPISRAPPVVVIIGAAEGRPGIQLMQQMKATPSGEWGVPEIVAAVKEFDAVPGQDEAGQINGIGPSNSPAGFPDGTANISAARKY